MQVLVTLYGNFGPKIEEIFDKIQGAMRLCGDPPVYITNALLYFTNALLPLKNEKNLAQHFNS